MGQGEQIYEDGVNIAARLESLADCPPVPTALHWRTQPPVAPVASLHGFSVDTLVGWAAPTFLKWDCRQRGYGSSKEMRVFPSLT